MVPDYRPNVNRTYSSRNDINSGCTTSTITTNVIIIDDTSCITSNTFIGGEEVFGLGLSFYDYYKMIRDTEMLMNLIKLRSISEDEYQKELKFSRHKISESHKKSMLPKNISKYNRGYL
jgi:hypothetical protein